MTSPLSQDAAVAEPEVKPDSDATPQAKNLSFADLIRNTGLVPPPIDTSQHTHKR